jgi:hypothetical protein
MMCAIVTLFKEGPAVWTLIEKEQKLFLHSINAQDLMYRLQYLYLMEGV